MSALFENGGKDIDSKVNFGLLMDVLYDKYYNYVLAECCVQVLGYQVPLYLQIFTDNNTVKVVLLQFCMTAQLTLFAKEVNAMFSEGLKEYFGEW